MTSPFFGYRLNRIMDVLNERANRTIRPHGLLIPGARVLLWLAHGDNRRAGELAESVSIDPSALSHILRRLAANGLIKRERFVEDNRSVVVSLTSAGRRLVNSLTPHFKMLDKALMKGFTAAEWAVVEKFLDRMYDNVLAFEQEQAAQEKKKKQSGRPRNGNAERVTAPDG